MLTLDIDQTNKMLDSIICVWNAIGHDVIEGMEEEDEIVRNSYGNEVCIEICIDANRLVTYGGADGEECQKLLTELVKLHGYPTVLKTLAKNICIY